MGAILLKLEIFIVDDKQARFDRCIDAALQAFFHTIATEYHVTHGDVDPLIVYKLELAAIEAVRSSGYVAATDLP